MASKYQNKTKMVCSRCNQKFLNISKNSKFTKWNFYNEDKLCKNCFKK